MDPLHLLQIYNLQNYFYAYSMYNGMKLSYIEFINF